MRPPISREELLAWNPATIVSFGWRDPEGTLRPELYSLWATAAATQFEAAAVAPRQLGATLEALRQVMPLHKGPPAARFAAAAEEALEVVWMMLDDPASAAVQTWLAKWVAAVRTDRDIADAMTYFLAVVRQYSALAAIKRGS